MTIAELIERLEKATGPDRELDDLIAGVVLNPGGEVRLEGMPSGEPGIKTYFYPDGTRGTSLRYSSSIDSALTLVPEGWGWLVRDFKGDGEEGAYADVPHLTIESNMDGQAFHKIPAIALCIAALKARAGGVK